METQADGAENLLAEIARLAMSLTQAGATVVAPLRRRLAA
jgi:hypothetical protein